MNIEYGVLRNDAFNALPALLAACGFARDAAMLGRFRLPLKNAARQ